MAEGAVVTEVDEEIETARAALWAEVAELAAVRVRLAALHDRIPPSPEEVADEDLPDELDVLSEIRAVTEIVICDRLDPLIQSLTTAAEYRPAART
jgi:hypothetical protein